MACVSKGHGSNVFPPPLYHSKFMKFLQLRSVPLIFVFYFLFFILVGRNPARDVDAWLSCFESRL